jgi:hypothetical protein
MSNLPHTDLWKSKLCVKIIKELPQIKFKFEDTDVEENKLLKVLSQGEKRALYILNILFEVKVRKNNSEESLSCVEILCPYPNIQTSF